MQVTDPRQTIDDALCLEYLGATAAAFHLSETFSAGENAGLRISLAALRDTESTPQSLIARLYAVENESLLQVVNCFGVFSFWRNFFRFGFVRTLADTQLILRDFGAEMLSSTPLLFNRPLAVFIAGSGERRILFASMVMDAAETSHQLSQRIATARGTLAALIPNDLAIVDVHIADVEKKFAQQLGFNRVTDDQLPLMVETDVVFQCVAALQSFAALLGELVYQIKANQIQDDSSALTVLHDGLKSRVAALQAFHLPKTDDMHALELARADIFAAWQAANQQAQKLANACTEVFKSIATVNRAGSKLDFTRNLQRTLSHTMIVKGTAPKKALQAASDLLKYCSVQKLAPDQIIPAELAKINSHLSEDTLQTLVIFEKDKNVGQYALAGKQQNVERHQTLLRALGQLTICLLVIGIGLAPLVSACGVKIGPKSAIDDLRPAVEYRGDLKPSATPSPAPTKRENHLAPTNH